MRLLLVALALAAPVAPPSVEKPEWAVRAQAPARATVGAPIELVVEVKTRAGFHLNDDYPLHLDVAAAAGLEPARARVDLDPMKREPCAGDAAHRCAARVTVAVTPRAAGPAHLGGTLAFSACSAERCLIEKVAVSAPVEVAAR